MFKSSGGPVIRLRGVRHNNLKNFDLELPLNRLIVITGLSGSGKSSLAFDTLFAEGQRRYIETFSPYARQFFDRMDKPHVDSIEGIPPAIAIEQRNAVKTTRSTVGTMTEICDYMKLLWPLVAQLFCPRCGQVVQKEPPQQIWSLLTADSAPEAEVIVAFQLPLTDKLPLAESLALVSRQGYQRLLVDGAITRIDELLSSPAKHAALGTSSLTVIQDRLILSRNNRPRFVEACEQAYHFGKGKLGIYPLTAGAADTKSVRRFSSLLHCARCDIEFKEPTSALFSFNNPVGACPTCRGFGRTIGIDYSLAMPDLSLTLADGVVKPWQSGQSAECQDDLLRVCKARSIPMDVPFNTLDRQWQDLIVNGDPEYGKDAAHQWPRAWYGVKGYFRWLESRSYKMHVRVLLSRYRSYTTCQVCHGTRFKPEVLNFRAAPGRRGNGFNLAEFYQLPISRALEFVEALASDYATRRVDDPVHLMLGEVRSRLEYLSMVGLGYLTLDRSTRSLSGGEVERVNLTTCLGTRLVNTLFVLDEPSVGLHARDVDRLVGMLERLRDAGNTVIVVEHEPAIMRAADQVLDLGPGHGAQGGSIIFQGPYHRLLKASNSITGQYLARQREVGGHRRRPVVTAGQGSERFNATRYESSTLLTLRDAPAPLRASSGVCRVLKITGATRHNLKDLAVEIPLGRMVCVTGVSGSGKSTLVREVLFPALQTRLNCRRPEPASGFSIGAEHQEEGEDRNSEPSVPGVQVTGANHLEQIVFVDQSILGKTPRSNPAVYIGAFDGIRAIYANSEQAKQRGLGPGAFSYNSAEGQCERCRGAGFEKIEMQFLSDVFIRCPDCGGRRYRRHVLEVKITPEPGPQGKPRAKSPARRLSIADLLECTVDEAIDFLAGFSSSRATEASVSALRWLQEAGLGYLQLGQPINTLSGGESQRLKLVRHLAETSFDSGSSVPTLFLFDEPTTGLHFDDIRILLAMFQRIVDAGHSLVVIEHNLELIRAADWVIDLGPEAGEGGGKVVVTGTPEEVENCPQSHTGHALRAYRQAAAEHRIPGARAVRGPEQKVAC